MTKTIDFSVREEPFNACLTIASMDLRTGGTSRTVPALALNLQSDLIIPHLFSLGELSFKFGGLHYGQNDNISYLGGRRNFIRFLKKKQIALVHDNGIWHPFNHMVSIGCRKLNIPRMVSPHGMLEPWAFHYKRWKKQIAWHLYQNKDLKTAVCFHATADSEAENIRKLGFKQPIAIIPNGVDFPPVMPPKQGPANDVRKALFLSRIHPKKGLKDLIRAWKQVNSDKWVLDIAGPDEGGHENEIKSLIKKLDLTSSVHFLGNLSDDEKWRVYRSSDLFILPTYSENFGIVVAEALAAETPVITTTGTPWRIIEEERCGWLIQPGETSLVLTLNQALRLSSQELHDMGQRGRAMVLRQFDWRMIALSMSNVYAWILHKGPKPECVIE